MFEELYRLEHFLKRKRERLPSFFHVRTTIVAHIAIRRLREQRGMSQEVFSGLAGMYKSHLGRIERGEKKPNLDSLCRIASALGMRPHELLRCIEQEHEKA